MYSKFIYSINKYFESMFDRLKTETKGKQIKLKCLNVWYSNLWQHTNAFSKTRKFFF